MPLWTPQFTDLPVTGGAQPKRYVDQTSWSALLDNFANWKDNVNAGGKNLSNLGLVAIAGGTYGSPAITLPTGGQYCLLGDRGVIQGWPSEGLTGTRFGHNVIHHGGVGNKGVITGAASLIEVGSGEIRFYANAFVTGGSTFTLAEIARINTIGLGVGTVPGTIFHIKQATDVNIRVSGNVALGAGSISINATNDANNSNIPLEVRASVVGFTLGRVRIALIPSYANNASAIAGGLVAGDLYQGTSGDPRPIYIVT